MSNHYHIVVKVDADASTGWTDHEVADRWLRLFKGPDIVRRCLNETIARMTNREDECKGRFWD